LRVSSLGALCWQADQLVWHDTLSHRRFALGAGAEEVLRCFTNWNPLSRLGSWACDQNHAERLLAIAERQRAANVPIIWQSQRHHVEEASETAWSRWGRLATLVHTETRNLRAERFMTPELSQRRLRDRLDHQPPPPACREVATSHRVVLVEAGTVSWARGGFVDVLSHHRSTRRFSAQAVPFEAVSALLRWNGGITELHEPTQTVFKASASGGGRHPTELYLHAHRIDGLRPGLYHLNTRRGELELLGSPQPVDALVELVGSQEWVADSGCLLFYTCVLARSTWRYSTPAPAACCMSTSVTSARPSTLLAAALGLGATFTAAIQDKDSKTCLASTPPANWSWAARSSAHRYRCPGRTWPLTAAGLRHRGEGSGWRRCTGDAIGSATRGVGSSACPPTPNPPLTSDPLL
jgi:SagB-type dehydrogenase family enzyme